MGKTDWTGVTAFGVGGWTLNNDEASVFARSLDRAFFLQLQYLTGEGVDVSQPRCVIDTVGVAEIEELQPDDTD